MIYRKDKTFVGTSPFGPTPTLPPGWRWLIEKGAIWYQKHDDPAWYADAYAFVDEGTGFVIERPKDLPRQEGTKYDHLRPIGTLAHDEVVNI